MAAGTLLEKVTTDADGQAESMLDLPLKGEVYSGGDTAGTAAASMGAAAASANAVQATSGSAASGKKVESVSGSTVTAASGTAATSGAATPSGTAASGTNVSSGAAMLHLLWLASSHGIGAGRKGCHEKGQGAECMQTQEETD